MPGPYYHYSILQDTLNGSVNLDRLEDEYNSDERLLFKLTGLKTSGDELRITTADDLGSGPGSQKEALDEIVDAHTGAVWEHPAEQVRIQNPDKTTANFPSTAKGTPIFQPNVVPAGYYFWGSGCFDDFEAVLPASGRGTGELLAWEVEGPDKTVAFSGRFFEHVYILGGVIACSNAKYNDWVTLTMVSPASTPEVRPGNDGNADKVLTPFGFSIIIPNPLGTGAWNVDGTTLECGEVNSGLSPVPSPTGTGMWNWDPTQTPSLTPVDNPLAPNGSFDLYDDEIALAQQANRYSLLYPGNVTPEAAVKGKKVLPHWLWRFTIHREDPGAVQVSVRLDTARLKTV